MEIKLIVEDFGYVLDEIITKMRNLGAEVKCNNNAKIKMSVNTQIPTKKQINDLVKEISEKEKNGEKIELMKLYQKAVEFYSAIGNIEYIVYLNKIRELIKQESEKEAFKIE